MKKKSLSVKKKNHNNYILNKLKLSKIKHIYEEFERSLDIQLSGLSRHPTSRQPNDFLKGYSFEIGTKINE